MEYPLSDTLSDLISAFLITLRPLITGAGRHDGLFPSCKGVPMGDGALYDAVNRWTRLHTGTPVNLHAFRRAAGTFLARHDPANVRASRDLLGHADLSTTHRHYIEVGTIHAAKALQQAVWKRCTGRSKA